MRPEELGLPFDDWRTHQLDTILALAASPKKIKLLQGPTGSGKSGVAVGLARALGATRSVICTSTIQLQDQYLGDFPELRTTMGRSNFPCLIVDATADEAPCNHLPPDRCPSFHECPYYLQRDAGLSASIAILNYSYWLRAANHAFLFGESRDRDRRLDMFFGDEAHELDDHLRQVVEIKLVASTFRQVGLALPSWRPPRLNDFGAWKDWARYTLAHMPDKQRPLWGSPAEDLRALKRQNAARSAVDRLNTLEDEWMIEADIAGNVTFKPLWAAEYASDYIFRHANSVVLMSATFLGAEQTCLSLGLDPKDVDYFEVKSTFPKENRPIVIRPSVRVSKDMTSGDQTSMVEAVDRVLDSHPDERGLVHTSSYLMADTLVNRSRHKSRLLTHRSGKDRVDVIRLFKQESSLPLVLVSPSLTTGIDLPEDQCRFVIVMKIPFPSLGDPTIKLRMKIGPDGLPMSKKGDEWYQWITACRLVQGLGRAVRSPTDQSTQYILDANAKWFIPRVRAILPDWVKEAIRWEVGTNDSSLVRTAMGEM